MNFKNVLTLCNEEQKEAKWNMIVEERKRHMIALGKRLKKEIFEKLFDLEMLGGKCPTCGKEWVKIEFNNKFLKGIYYEPSCDCFIQCPECETWLYDKQYEYAGKLKYCDNCFFKLVETETGKKRYGKEYLTHYKSKSRKKQLEILNDR